MRYHSLTKRFIFLCKKKKKKIVYLLGCANSWKLWMYLPRKDSTCYRIAIISIDFYFIYLFFFFLLLCIRFLVTKFLEEEYIRRLS